MPEQLPEPVIDPNRQLLVLYAGGALVGAIGGTSHYLFYGGDPHNPAEFTRHQYLEGQIAKANDVIAGSTNALDTLDNYRPPTDRAVIALQEAIADDRAQVNTWTAETRQLDTSTDHNLADGLTEGGIATLVVLGALGLGHLAKKAEDRRRSRR